MLVPLRRALGQRVFQSSCRICFRRYFHIERVLRANAAAQVQVDEEYTALHSFINAKKGASRPKAVSTASHQSLQKIQSPPTPSQKQQKAQLPKQQQKAQQSKKKQQRHQQKKGAQPSPNGSRKAAVKDGPPLSQDPADILPTAANIRSPYNWTKDDVLRLYPMPPEPLIPPVLTRSTKNSSETFDYRIDAYKYLEGGLQLKINVETHQLRAEEGGGYRVRIAASWARHGAVAIGDGSSKVRCSSS